MEKIIHIETHALLRIIERGERFGLTFEETKERVFQVIKTGSCPNKKHLSINHCTYYKYFNDNLSFYVICEEKKGEFQNKILVKTIIIEEGRE